MKQLFRQFTSREAPLTEFSSDEFDIIKFKARIAFVDDEEIGHVKRLQKDGYNIADYSDIDNIDDFLRKKYHVIVLDIQGVGTSIAGAKGGWGVLEYIKREAPHLVIIMFTGADWSVTKYKSQVDIADDIIGKDVEYLDFKSKLDAAIRKAFSARFHFEVEKSQITKEIVNSNSLREIEEILFKYGKNKNKAIRELRKVTKNENVVQAADNFLSIMSSIFSLITT